MTRSRFQGPHALPAFTVALVLAACAPPVQEPTAEEGPCAAEVTVPASLTAEPAPTGETLFAAAAGAACASASLTLKGRNADGTEILALSFPYDAMRHAAPPPGPPAPVSLADMQAFLASWAAPSEAWMGALPDWPEGQAAPGPAALPLTTTLPREAYLALRARNTRHLCFQAGVTRTACFHYDADVGRMVPTVEIG